MCLFVCLFSLFDWLDNLDPLIHIANSQRFARADKRAKLPKWINQYITEASTNLSTDMSLVMAKKFLRSMAQPFEQDQLHQSLWTLEDVEARQRKQQAETQQAGGGRLVQSNGMSQDAEMVDAY